MPFKIFAKIGEAMAKKGGSEKETPRAADAPASQPVAAPVPPVTAAPAGAAVSPAAVRDSLDEMGEKLIMLGESYLNIGQQMQELRSQVAEKPCAFEGFDRSIIGAVSEFEHLCSGCTPEEVSELLGKVEAAINARTLVADNSRKFVLMMETHYYSLQLIILQGRMNYNALAIAADTATLASYEEQLVAEEIIETLNAQIRATKREQNTIRENIVTCQQGLRSAVRELNRSGAVEAIDATKVFNRMHSSIAEMNTAYEAAQRSKAEYAAKLDMLLQDEALVVAREKAFQTLQEKQRLQRRELVQHFSEDSAPAEKPAETPFVFDEIDNVTLL